MPRLSFALVCVVLPLAGVTACGKTPDANRADTTSGTAASSPTSGASASTMVRGTVDSVSATNLVVTSDSGKVTLRLASAVQVFDRKPATLADVKDNTFIGVTTVKQPDGTEQATEIHIFPEALRGLGEGSRMMAQNPSGAAGGGNRMTNGAVSASRMTNGTAGSSPASRMTNGSVSGGGSSTMVVQFAGGSQKVTVPPNTPVTELAPTSKPLAAGDRIVALATRNPDGSLGTNRVLLAQK